jgi:hypothetical protein
MAAMSGEELAAALYAEQGYVVTTGDRPWKVGEISTRPYFRGMRGVLGVPLRVVAESNVEEYNRQIQLANRLAPDMGPAQQRLEPPVLYYRCEAAD